MQYLLFGRETFLKREFIRALRDKLFPKDSGFGDFQEFTAKKDPLNSVLDFILTAPFLSEKRLAVLWNVDDLPKDDQVMLLSFLDKKIPSAELVIESEQSSIKKNSFLTAISGKCHSTPCYTLFDKDLPRWIQTQAQKRGKQIDKQAAGLLIERVGKDLAALDLALEQLAVFTSTTAAMAFKDVETLLGKSVQADVFQVLDFIIENRPAEALTLLSSLAKQREKSYEIMGGLVGGLERFRKAAVMLEKNNSAQNIGAVLNIHPFYLEKFLSQARRISSEKCDQILRELLRCDECIKTGSLNDERALERFVLEVC